MWLGDVAKGFTSDKIKCYVCMYVYMNVYKNVCIHLFVDCNAIDAGGIVYIYEYLMKKDSIQ